MRVKSEEVRYKLAKAILNFFKYFVLQIETSCIYNELESHRSTIKLIQEKSLEIKRFFVFQASSIDNEGFMVFTPLHTIWQNNSSLMLLCPPLALHSIIDIILRI